MIKYFEVSDILKIHNKVLKLSGGLKGYKDKLGLKKVCDFVQNDLYYPEFLDKLEYIIFSISKNHFFNDGNKRTSIAVGAYFLIENWRKNIEFFKIRTGRMQILLEKLIKNIKREI